MGRGQAGGIQPVVGDLGVVGGGGGEEEPEQGQPEHLKGIDRGKGGISSRDRSLWGRT